MILVTNVDLSPWRGRLVARHDRQKCLRDGVLRRRHVRYAHHTQYSWKSNSKHGHHTRLSSPMAYIDLTLPTMLQCIHAHQWGNVMKYLRHGWQATILCLWHDLADKYAMFSRRFQRSRWSCGDFFLDKTGFWTLIEGEEKKGSSVLFHEWVSDLDA
jgi:hypothetical protein